MGQPLLDHGEQRSHAAAEEHEHQHGDREDGHDHQGQPPVGVEEDREGGHHQDQGLAGHEQTLGDELADLFHIVRGPHHQLAGALPVVVRKAEAADLGEQFVAEVIGGVLTVLLGHVGLEEGEDAAAD